MAFTMTGHPTSTKIWGQVGHHILLPACTPIALACPCAEQQLIRAHTAGAMLLVSCAMAEMSTKNHMR